jgi:hypothetical protein
MLQDLAAVDTHPLAATAARYVGLLPLIPLAGFLVNGALSLIPATSRDPAIPRMRDTEPTTIRPWIRTQWITPSSPERPAMITTRSPGTRSRES